MDAKYEWPIVASNDDGIRPAGPRDACFYCGQKVGRWHLVTCVVVTKRVELLVVATLPDGSTMSGTWQTDEPHSFTALQIEGKYNQGSWCASNIAGEAIEWEAGRSWADLAPYERRMNGCLCGLVRFEFARVVDERPNRLLRGPSLN